MLKLSKELAPYVLTKPLHGSQKVKEKTAEGAVITIEVIPNYELITQILSMGAGVEVLEPETFREQIKAIAATIYKKYNS